MTNWDEQTDVIVVGSGLAGLAAAIEAVQAGASVVVFEKMKLSGGNTRISDGGVAAPGNDLQKKQGIDDSPELFYEDMLRAGLGLNHPQLVRTVAEKAAETIEWTRSELGVKYLDRLDRFGGHSVARCLTTRNHSGSDIIRAQTARLNQLGVKIRTRCMLTGFVTDDSGSVCGIEIRDGYLFPDKNSGTKKKIGARRGVVLATGGFVNDLQFRMLQNPALNDTIGSTNHRGATAEATIAALKINAVPVQLSWIQMGPWGCADESGYGKGGRFASYSVFPGGILIDPETGRRIVNEWGDRRQRCDAMMKTGHVCLGIVDARGAEKDAESLQYCLKNGKVRAFDNLDDLAEACGVPPQPLNMTVNEYNNGISEGRTDEFGKPLDKALPLDRPPFYVVRLWPKVHYTPGGIGINSKTQVIDLNGQPIDRLYAAGEVCGGIHGASRLGSCALSECLVFGRIAGQQAAAMPRRDE